MALKIEDERAERLAQEFASRTGEPVEEAIAVALEERLDRVGPQQNRKPDLEAIQTILARVRSLPDLDPRSSDSRSHWLVRPTSASARAGILQR